MQEFEAGGAWRVTTTIANLKLGPTSNNINSNPYVIGLAEGTTCWFSGLKTTQDAQLSITEIARHIKGQKNTTHSWEKKK